MASFVDLPSAILRFTAPHVQSQALHAAFGAPLHILTTQRSNEVAQVLNAAHQHAKEGRWCVGFVSFEAASAFDVAYELHSIDQNPSTPLVWFAVYDNARAVPSPTEQKTWHLTAWESTLTPDQFAGQVRRIHEAIADGEVYQINLSSPLQSRFEGDVLGFFDALCRAQPNSYSAYLNLGDMQILSVSPELFFDWRQGHILSRPMKGTAARGQSPTQDQAMAQALRESSKEQAENLMIVDLIRNDLSRIAKPFSVQVEKLFALQAWPTIWQMTSDVLAQTRPGTQLSDVFAALFPCGSVTGAPKVRAMHWIKQLEARARGVYCGAIGVLQPGGAATFSVAIRTVTLQGQLAHCGIGSGITADATATDEWQEWRNKQIFLRRCESPFDLLETLRMEEGQFPHWPLHRARLQEAAAYFGYAIQHEALEQSLASLSRQHPHGVRRVRLCSNAQGEVSVTAYELPPTLEPVHVQLASRPIPEAHSEFVRFKTTRRSHYDAFAPSRGDVFDTLLFNASGELTEFTRGNVAVLLDGQWLTPPPDCGLLAGVGRALALGSGRIKEQRITLADLKRAQGLAFVNSLRGWLMAELRT
jgi:para-aminobenzoate synthetase / 4-amino-4-deoxychorismate lyase